MQDQKLLSERNSNEKQPIKALTICNSQGVLSENINVSNYLKLTESFQQYTPKYNQQTTQGQNNQSSNVQNFKSPQFFCHQHPNKKAKYFLPDSKNHSFCSKCALKYANKGYKVEEREQDILNYKDCQQNLNLQYEKNEQNLFQQLNSMLEQVQENSEKIKDHYTSQTEKILFFFDSLEQYIDDCKNRILVDVNKHFNDKLELIESYEKQIQTIKILNSQQNSQTNQYRNQHEQQINELNDEIKNKMLKNLKFIQTKEENFKHIDTFMPEIYEKNPEKQMQRQQKGSSSMKQLHFTTKNSFDTEKGKITDNRYTQKKNQEKHPLNNFFFSSNKLQIYKQKHQAQSVYTNILKTMKRMPLLKNEI